MRWEQLLPCDGDDCGDSLTAHEEANQRAAQHRRDRSWAGLIHLQRRRRVACEVEKLTARLTELRATDPDRYYDGDWDEVLDGLIFWHRRDPHDETHWAVEEGT